MTTHTSNPRLVLMAMIFAVAMMFIDQTIVALAIPDLQKDLSLSTTGAQWIINGYLLSLPRCSCSAASSPTCSAIAGWSRSA